MWFELRLIILQKTLQFCSGATTSLSKRRMQGFEVKYMWYNFLPRNRKNHHLNWKSKCTESPKYNQKMSQQCSFGGLYWIGNSFLWILMIIFGFMLYKKHGKRSSFIWYFIIQDLDPTYQPPSNYYSTYKNAQLEDKVDIPWVSNDLSI